MRYPCLILQITSLFKRLFEDRETKRQRLIIEYEEAQLIPDLWERYDALIKVSIAQSDAEFCADARTTDRKIEDTLSQIMYETCYFSQGTTKEKA